MGGWVDGWLGGWVDGWLGGLVGGSSGDSVRIICHCTPAWGFQDLVLRSLLFVARPLSNQVTCSWRHVRAGIWVQVFQAAFRE